VIPLKKFLAFRPAILIVEDEVLVLLAIADCLRDYGFQVIEACSGDVTMVVLQSTVAVDLVFTDVQMPGECDGFVLARWLHAERPGLPVLITAGGPTNAAMAKELCGKEPFFAKPYDVARVVSHIRVLGIRRPLFERARQSRTEKGQYRRQSSRQTTR